MWRSEGRRSSRPSAPRIGPGHAWCLIAGVIALAVAAWAIWTMIRYGGYYVRPFDNGG